MTNALPIILPQSSESRFTGDFAVLPDGNFLINDEDHSPVYREYYSSGNDVGQPTGKYIDLTSHIPINEGLAAATGVTLAPDGTFYFVAGYLDQAYKVHSTTLIHTDSSGQLIVQPQNPQTIGNDGIEDIDVVTP